MIVVVGVLVFLALTVECRNSAIIISTSRYWPNYRDQTNIGFFHDTVKQNGVGTVVSMFSEEIACNPLNPYPGQVYSASPELYKPIHTSPATISGNEVSRDKVLRFLRKRQPAFTPRSHRLNSNSQSRVFVYFTGHSAVGYSKFQDFEDVDARDIAHAIEHLWQTGAYSQLLWVGDTCRAASIHNPFYSPGVTAVGSTNEIEKSYSMPTVGEIGESLIDRFTVSSQQLFGKLRNHLTLGEYANSIETTWLNAHITHKINENGPGLDREVIEFVGDSDRIQPMNLKTNDWGALPAASGQNDISTRARSDGSATNRVIKSARRATSWTIIWIIPLVALGFILVVV